MRQGGLFMTVKIPIRLILLIMVSAVLLGCSCFPKRGPDDPIRIIEPYRPLTPAILYRLQHELEGDLEENIKDHQFLLLGGIVLERVDATRPPPRTDDEGIFRFQDVFHREIVSIHDGTLGVAVDLKDLGNNHFIISISFERSGEINPDRFYLEFMSTNYDEPFSLVYVPQLDMNPRPLQMPVIPTSTMIDERGTLRYGNNEYQLRYSGRSKPYIMIRLAQDDYTDVNRRIVRGRRVGE